jgi:hypothetical protein
MAYLPGSSAPIWGHAPSLIVMHLLPPRWTAQLPCSLGVFRRIAPTRARK